MALVAMVPNLGAQGCSDAEAQKSTYSLRQSVNEFDKSPVVQSQSFLVTGSKMNIRAAQIKLTAISRMVESTRVLDLKVDYRGRGPLNIAAGESLQFMADDARIALSGAGSEGTRVQTDGGTVNNVKRADEFREYAVFAITPKQLQQIANASELSVRIVGERNVDLVVPTNVLCALKRFAMAV
jgi:hypothetical protein